MKHSRVKVTRTYRGITYIIITFLNLPSEVTLQYLSFALLVNIVEVFALAEEVHKDEEDSKDPECLLIKKMNRIDEEEGLQYKRSMREYLLQ